MFIMSNSIPFCKEVDSAFFKIVDRLAPDVWSEADVDFSNVRLSAGNAADYGRDRASYKNGIVSFPTSNRHSCFVEKSGEYVPRVSVDDACGVLWHELGHHVIAESKNVPWSAIRAGQSTHSEPGWCWVVGTAWKHFHPNWEGSPEIMAQMYLESRKGVGVPSFAKVLSSFHGPGRPPEIKLCTMLSRSCDYCGKEFYPERKTAKFCSNKCRVAQHRAK
ncbi:MAG: hypothetical protein DRR42_01530 [Gammaproteobacteria bacterium]|nr:MAG: hypothetical protein DRR42_01530 [Gammaproteobacteria bacterium]